ncbi:MAG: hypothetical protein WC414_03135 [Patescibacteria group bacterium]
MFCTINKKIIVLFFIITFFTILGAGCENDQSEKDEMIENLQKINLELKNKIENTSSTLEENVEEKEQTKLDSITQNQEKIKIFVEDLQKEQNQDEEEIVGIEENTKKEAEEKAAEEEQEELLKQAEEERQKELEIKRQTEEEAKKQAEAEAKAAEEEQEELLKQIEEKRIENIYKEAVRVNTLLLEIMEERNEEANSLKEEIVEIEDEYYSIEEKPIAMNFILGQQAKLLEDTNYYQKLDYHNQLIDELNELMLIANAVKYSAENDLPLDYNIETLLNNYGITTTL